MNMIKFKEREATLGIALDYVKADMPMDKYEREKKGEGWFSVGYNYLLHADGSMEVGVPKEQFSCPEVPHYRDHICVLVMGMEDGQTNKLQESALAVLSEELHLPIVR